ncbi:flagellar biosynthesis anti-sigma factor FlgM [Paraburkholderia caballeronis]|uniref:Negative regulator of flagellin synthesis n=1 Tax=Paraburkholderia caballeronis TaxID=416943 RepID=A0A1H7SLM1_9BURK|nr:flagellar biosynthesis anti-sigma factor FlgM [Paraburkholderia caballeronis]PXW22379.1 FlgM family anti-sigma-28 factor [Paraburkholderia caballeronis]PXW96037.1 FlgM family anti-sigma-28 factor [Paraburkholderia caballeronis]RAJ92403.1 FlgM family anti-sigma-28 factor [Paraburkholderia caballeronis]TDV08052.1 FlgM family anti-sigma-28 factor [Paraburkholderia caballeronis]TDV11884.1 FlgM family anti-sigma-28 factor [Paraburkholderia caballeronis]
MKIDSSQSRARSAQDGVARTQQGGSAGQAGSASTGGASATASGGGDASVSLSSLSSQLRSLAASGAADIDTAHVESIKDAIRNGTLQIDTGKIADGVLETARSLLQPSDN